MYNARFDTLPAMAFDKLKRSLPLGAVAKQRATRKSPRDEKGKEFLTWKGKGVFGR